MSKEGSAADDLREKEAAQAAVGQDVQAAEGAEAKKSYIAKLAPEAKTTEAREAFLETFAPAPKVPVIEEVRELPSFEEAKAEIQLVTQGDNQATDRLAKFYGSKGVRYIKRMPTALDGGPGWHCQAHEKSPLTHEQSQELADAINDKIDVEAMRETAERNRALKKGKTAKKGAQPAAEAEAAAESINELIEKVSETVPSITTLDHLTEIVFYCKRHKLLKVFFEGRRWKKVEGLKGNEASHKLAQAINSKKKELLKEIGRKKNRIEAFKEEIEYCPNMVELDKTAWKIHLAGFIVKKFTGPTAADWEVEPIKGKQGSRELAEALNKRHAELLEDFKKQ